MECVFPGVDVGPGILVAPSCRFDPDHDAMAQLMGKPQSFQALPLDHESRNSPPTDLEIAHQNNIRKTLRLVLLHFDC